MLRDAGHRADPLSVGELEKLQEVDKPPCVHPMREGKPRGERGEKRPNKTKDGDEICYGYNSAKRCVLPGGHCSKDGRKYTNKRLTQMLSSKHYSSSNFFYFFWLFGTNNTIVDFKNETKH
jgi:hypothetical protein